jgi:hypothetical protein
MRSDRPAARKPHLSSIALIWALDTSPPPPPLAPLLLLCAVAFGAVAEIAVAVVGFSTAGDARCAGGGVDASLSPPPAAAFAAAASLFFRIISANPPPFPPPAPTVPSPGMARGAFAAGDADAFAGALPEDSSITVPAPFTVELSFVTVFFNDAPACIWPNNPPIPPPPNGFGRAAAGSGVEAAEVPKQQMSTRFMECNNTVLTSRGRFSYGFRLSWSIPGCFARALIVKVGLTGQRVKSGQHGTKHSNHGNFTRPSSV